MTKKKPDAPLVPHEIGPIEMPTVPKPNSRTAGLMPAWNKGQTGNPTGLNAITKFMARVREATNNGQDIINVLKDCLHDKNPAIQIQAAKVLLERGWGNAPQSIVLDDRREKPLDLSHLSADELKILERVFGQLKNEKILGGED